MIDRSLTTFAGKKISIPVSAIILFIFTCILVSHLAQRMWPLDAAFPSLPPKEQYRWLEAVLLAVFFTPVLFASKITAGEIIGPKPALDQLFKVSILAALILILFGFAEGFFELGRQGFGSTIALTPVQADVPFSVVITLDRFSNLPLGAWLGFASIVVIAPITEEFVYRGILLRRMLARLPVSAAIGASSLVFMLAHLGQGQLVITFLAGVMFAFLYLKTGNLRYGILAHALVNLNAVAQRSIVDFQGRGGDELFGLSLPYTVVALLALLMFILMLSLNKIVQHALALK